VEVIPIPVTHGDWTILGFRIGSFAYITDTNGIPPASMKLLDGVRILALDGLRPSPRHPTHFTVDEAVACAQEIGAPETWLIHLTHEVDHDEVEATLPAGIRLAYDGLVLEID
jgi:phosphoribosyl 1,2-cyclic phosphate phosphodiesterase